MVHDFIRKQIKYTFTKTIVKLIVMLPDFYADYIMDDKMFLLADKCCQWSGTCVLVALLDFGCEMNCCAELRVAKEL